MASFSEYERLSDADRNRVEATIGAFEAAWSRGDRPPITAFLAAGDRHRSLLVVELIQSELEFRLKAGEPARVEFYLESFPELRARSEVVIDLIGSEWKHRSRLERGLTVKSFLDRFPDLAIELALDSSLRSVGATALCPPERPPAICDVGPLPRPFGKYELRQNVGCGAFAFVYRAWDPLLLRDFAIKIPRPEVAASPPEIANFFREARNALDLRHPNIVAICDARPIDGTVCMVSEFIEGMTLAERLRIGPLGFVESANMMILVLGALHHAHGQKIIHRDLKPSNILLDRDEQPHLTDFGLAKRSAGDSTISPLGASRVMIGTLTYMAPEQARGDSSQVDARSDVYTAGVVLFEMLTGSVPFRGRGQLLQIQIEEVPPPQLRALNDEVHPDLETICLKALAKDPRDRYQSAEAMATDLASFIAGRPIWARPLVALLPPIARSRRPGWTRVAISAAILAVLAGLVLNWRAMSRQRERDSNLIEQLVRSAVASLPSPALDAPDPADEHRRTTRALRQQSAAWVDLLAGRPDLADLRADVLVEAADNAAAVGFDPETRVAWERVVADLEPRRRTLTPEHQVDLARGLTALGELSANAGATARAQELARRAASVWNSLIRVERERLTGSPDDLSIALSLAERILESERNSQRGGLYPLAGEVSEVVNRLKSRADLDPPVRLRLVKIELTLAGRYQATGELSRMAYWGRQAIRSATIEPAVEVGADIALELARAQLIVGLAATAESSPDLDTEGETTRAFRTAIEGLGRATQLDPMNLDLKRQQAAAEAGLGSLLAARGPREEAIHHYRRALDLSRVVRQARPLAHADLAASARIRAGLAGVVEADLQVGEALKQLAVAVLEADRAWRLAPGIRAYRDARLGHAQDLTRVAVGPGRLGLANRFGDGRMVGEPGR